ncbi:MAG: hypothetical protein ACTSP9_05940 [Promethearchaeota archaeon]
MKRKGAIITILCIVIASATIIYLGLVIEGGNANQPPIINNYYPLVNPYINETEIQEFNVSATDPDGDPLTFGWYLNETEVGENLNSYLFDANTNPNGTYYVKVNITDGYNIINRHWIMTVSNLTELGTYITNHNYAHLEDLKSIPTQWIEDAKQNLNIVYGHTSHGSQLTSGMANLDAFMGGDDIYLYGPNGASNDSILEFYDFNGGFGGALTTTDASDLGNPNDDAWAAATEEYLDHPSNPGTNVIMWSWCNIAGHNIPGYLSHMEDLISKYSAGGSKGRTSTNEVKFVFMTGHVDGQGIGGTNNLQNELIREHCGTYNRILFDFADIESYDPDDNYFLNLNVADDCSYTGGNWATEWIVGKTEMTSISDTANNEPNGGDWYQCGAAHTHPLNSNLKAYACWYLFARLAGWEGN